jgi:asparagine synthase (glutamine-hydrolysing)
VPQGKAILRDIFSRTLGGAGRPSLPPSVLRRGKMGFGVPVSDWLAGPQAEWMRMILLDRRTLERGLFAPAAVAQMIAAHTARRADHGEQLWALVCLELWFRAFGGCGCF